MSQRTEIVRIAAGEIGYKEGANNNTKYGVWYGMNNNPWCAMFVSWCARQAGVPMGVIPNLAYVPYIQATYDRQGAWMPRGSGYSPLPGDLVIFGKNDHIGIVEGVSNNRLITIEGNTSASGNSSNGDGVYRRNRSINDSWIKGYCTPKYEEELKVDKVLLFVNDEKVSVPGVLIDDENYVHLKTIAMLLGANVTYDAGRKMPIIETLEHESTQTLDKIADAFKSLSNWRKQHD